jgi:hypothetical protein
MQQDACSVHAPPLLSRCHTPQQGCSSHLTSGRAQTVHGAATARTNNAHGQIMFYFFDFSTTLPAWWSLRAGPHSTKWQAEVYKVAG